MLRAGSVNAVVCVLCLCLGAGTILLADSPDPASARLIDATVLTLLNVTACWILFLSIRAYPAATGLTGYALLLAGLVAVAVWWSHSSLLFLFLDTHSPYARWTTEHRWTFLLLESAALAWPAVTMAQVRRTAMLDEKLRQQADASALLREAELFRLRQQLQPHFLFNSLNAVSSLILVEPAKAVETIGQLSGFLRTAVRRDAQALVPLTEEFDYISTYLSIESVRFGDRLQVSMPEEVPADALIPPAILQPLLENAVKFGIYGVTGTVDILVQTAADTEGIAITISNPYDPQGARRPGTGFGLEGVRRRLYLLYGRSDLVRTEAGSQHFTVHILIPQPRV